jgi:penicillin-binding protein 2
VHSRQNKYSSRKYIIQIIFIVIGIIFLIRLFMLQVVDNKYKLSAQNNVLRYVTQYPARGLIYDRNENLLVYNEACYDLLVIPRQVKNINVSLLCNLLKIDSLEYVKRLQKAGKYSKHRPSVFLEQISKEDYGYLEEQLYKFPGFFVQARTLRKYPYSNAAHLLGYVSEVDKNNLKKDPYYLQGDYIGKSGIERFYEESLRGKKGLKIKMVDVFNREKGSFQDGKYDTLAIAGEDLFLSIDIDLQAYGERLMANKRGSIVAIEPKSGEILALISCPTYDPNLLVGRVRGENFSVLSNDTLKPLLNRAIMAQYPPGSTFKLVSAVIGLSEGVLHTYTKYHCKGTNAKPIVCSHDHESPLDLYHAIEQSCNPYFWKVFRSIFEQEKFKNIQDAYTNWRNNVVRFGIGDRLLFDLNGQRGGNLPEHTYFDKYYTKKGWKAITIRSLSVGQGEIELTPLQMANVVSIFANRGYYYSPHIVKSIGSDKKKNTEFLKRQETGYPANLFEKVIDGMELVYEGEHGSARYYKSNTIKMCGKTGTAENPHGKSHSVFVAFAPVDDPQIAIAVIVENSGYGSLWAAPIASLMMKKYLNVDMGSKYYEDKMLNANLIGQE